MNSSLNTILPGRTLGNLALAGSLFLHVGLITLFSSWQWELGTPPKNPPKVVKVKILPASTAQKDTQRPVPEKTARFSPAQPITVPSPSIPTLTARTPRSSAPAFQPESWVKQTMASPKMQFKPRKVQRISLSAEATKPQAVRSAKTNQERHNSKQIISIKPSPTLNPSLTESTQPTAPAGAHESGQPTVVQHRSPSRPAGFSKIPATVSKTALSTKSPKRELNNIHQRPSPTPSQIAISTEASSTAQQVAKSFTSPLKPRSQPAALLQKLFKNPPTVHDDFDVNLNTVRGLFTGQVRQRIADAKYYPRIARRRGMEGQPVVAFTLNKRGGLMKANLAQTSGYQLLDRAALEAVHQAAPYPEIPAELKADTYQFKLPISFVLK